MYDTGIPKQYEYDSFDGYVDALEEFARVANKERNDALQMARELRDALEDVHNLCLDKTIETHPGDNAKGCIDECIDIAKDAIAKADQALCN